MIHLYNLGFNGRYVRIDCNLKKASRTFDEEAGRHHGQFALGRTGWSLIHFQDMLSVMVSLPFPTFMACDISSATTRFS
jgi:hypothetical protein